MPQQNRTYTFNNVGVFVNGSRIEGFWQGDDAVMIEENADVSQTTMGADGHGITSVSTDNSATITLKLQPTGPGHALMKSLYKRYKLGRPFTFPTNVNDVGTGEGGSSTDCTISQAPSTNLGQQGTAREWKIFAPCFIDNDVVYAGA